MRIKGTKYESIDKLPAKGLPVSTFAQSQGLQVPQVYIKYDRFTTGKSSSNPGYIIRCYLGSNFVIPN